MSDQEKWKGLFGRLGKYRPKTKRGLSVKKSGSGNCGDGSTEEGVAVSTTNENTANVSCWSESFDKLMACESGRKAFRTFLRCEYSEENILFWLACEELKRERHQDRVEEKARIIYEDFVSILSPREVSLDSRVRETINQNMVSPSRHTFDEAQLQIYTLMHRDSYPRFISSAACKELESKANAEGHKH